MYVINTLQQSCLKYRFRYIFGNPNYINSLSNFTLYSFMYSFTMELEEIPIEILNYIPQNFFKLMFDKLLIKKLDFWKVLWISFSFDRQ